MSDDKPHPKPWERGPDDELPILFVDESVCSVDVAQRIADSKPGDIIFVPPGFRWIELNPKNVTIKEGGFMFEWTPDGLKRLR